MQKDYTEFLEGIKEWLEETKDEPLESMGGFFTSRVDGYEEHMKMWTNYYKWMADLIPENSDTLLDLGCGTGLELDYIFKKYPNLKVTGVDLTQSMLDKLKEKHSDKNLNLICGDYFTVDMGKNLYDVAVSVESFHHFELEKKVKLYKKIYESLKIGGTLIQCDYIAVNEEHEKLLYSEYCERRKKSNIPEGTFVHFDIPVSLEHEFEALRLAGFKNIKSLGSLEDEATQMIIVIK